MTDTLGPYELNTIVTGDALELAKAIPDDAIGLINIDPPYNVGKDYGDTTDDSRDPGKYLEWYRRMVAECYRILGNGYLYVSCSLNQIWELRPIYEEAGFSFRTMCLWHGPNYAGNSNTIRGEWRLLYEPIMMFCKGARVPMLNEVRGYNTDCIMTYTRPQRDFGGDLQRHHPTQKPTALYINIIARTPGNPVLDLFMGAGTTAKACKLLGRDYLGFEINPEFAEMARQRVANTQPPLFVPEMEQLSFDEVSP